MRPSLTLYLAPLVIGALAAAGCTKRETPKQATIVAIATLMAHPALDQVEASAREELARRGFVEGANTRFVVRNANGQPQLAASIPNELAAANPGVIVAITTPMAQAVAKVARCPVVFAAVTDPVGAGIVPSLEKPQPQVTGTSDAWPYAAQLRLIREITPNARKLGVLYNPGEAASQYGIRKIREYASSFGFELVEGAVSTTAEVYPVAQNLVGRVDALFLSSDNTVIGGVAGAVKVAAERKKALYVGDSGTVAKGGLAAVSVGYAELGRKTGELAGRMLSGERNLPVVVGEGAEIHVNRKAAELMGVTLPPAVLARAAKVYDVIEP